MSSMILTPEEYKKLKAAFQGGFTHAAARYVNTALANVSSYDFSSSYPAVMLSEKFPCGKGRHLDSVELNYILEKSHNHCFTMVATFENLIEKTEIEHPLSLSKCISANIKQPLIDNGRIIAAESIQTVITEQDLLTYLQFYDYSKLTLTDIYEYDKQYLPKEFIEAILTLYERKTQLKGVAEREIDYMVSKGMLNASFGMSVTDIVRPEYIYDPDNEETPFYKNTDKMDDAEYTNFLSEKISDYNKNPYRFLFYPWGVWVTAYARRNLFTGIYAVGKDYVYSDTDSVKLKNLSKHKKYFNDYNKQINEKLRKMCEFYKIDFSRTRPKNIKGVEKPLGIWEYEGTYESFKTLGAKRYLLKDEDGWKLTLAGVNKKKGVNYLIKLADENGDSPTDHFNFNLTFPPEHSGRLISTYIDAPKTGAVKDYLGNSYEYEELSSIHMEGAPYELSPALEFLNYITQVKEDSW